MPISRSFYFIRHGQTDWNLEGRMQGCIDIPLNDTGREQARAAIPYFKNLGIDLIVSSPLKRAYETAEIIGNELQIDIKSHTDLQERCFGSNQGRLSAEVKKEYQENPEGQYLIEVGDFPHAIDSESYFDLQKRVINAVHESLNSHSGTLLFAGHGGVFSSLYRFLVLGEESLDYVRSDNAIPYYFKKHSDGSWMAEKVTG